MADVLAPLADLDPIRYLVNTSCHQCSYAQVYLGRSFHWGNWWRQWLHRARGWCLHLPLGSSACPPFSGGSLASRCEQLRDNISSTSGHNNRSFHSNYLVCLPSLGAWMRNGSSGKSPPTSWSSQLAAAVGEEKGRAEGEGSDYAWSRRYLVLGVGKGAVKIPEVLKLQVVWVEFHHQHPSRGDCDLRERARSTI